MTANKGKNPTNPMNKGFSGFFDYGKIALDVSLTVATFIKKQVKIIINNRKPSTHTGSHRLYFTMIHKHKKLKHNKHNKHKTGGGDCIEINKINNGPYFSTKANPCNPTR